MSDRPPWAVPNARFVRDDGSKGAPIVCIGEAPGRDETAMGRPFVGHAGKLLKRWQDAVGIRRTDCHWMNLSPWQPRGNDMSLVPEEDKAAYRSDLEDRIAALDDPYVLAPMGNYAMKALLPNLPKGITSHRGYLYEYTDRRGRVLKVIPTIHPAATFKQAASADTAEGKKGRRSWKVRCQMDWARIAGDRHFKELRLPEREHYIRPTLDDVRWLAREVVQAPNGDGACLMLDIETPRTRVETITGYSKSGTAKVKRTWGPRQIACIGFSLDPAWSMTIPCGPRYWGSEKKWQTVLALLKTILSADVPKGTQNGLFDWYWLATEWGIWPRRWTIDTMAMHAVIDPVEQHSLEFQASVFLRTQYWKDEGKESDETTQLAVRDLDRFWRYNGKDAAHQRELAVVHGAVHSSHGLDAVYQSHYQRLFLPLLDLAVRGVPVDNSRRRLCLARCTARLLTARATLTQLAGEDLYGATDLSPAKLKRFLYETLGLPEVKKITKTAKGRERRVTTNRVTIRRLTLKYPEQLGTIGPLILDTSRIQKKSEFYDDKLVDADGRSRCQYGWAETCRLKSRENPKETGRNHQNFDRECRDHVLPELGHIGMKLDLSQAESREMYVETGDPELVRLARVPPWEHDQHRYNAAIIFGCAESAVTKEQRYIGKRAVHASQRDMRGMKLAEELMRDVGIVRTPEECQAMIDRYFAAGAHGAIRDVYFKRVRHLLINDKKLTGSRGFTMHFNEERIDDDLFRRGYSFFPQYEIAQVLADGFVTLWHYLRRRPSRILMHVHDELFCSLSPGEAWDVYQVGRMALEQPIRCTNSGTELIIPTTLTLCHNYSGEPGVEFKRPPARREFEDAMQALLAERAA